MQCQRFANYELATVTCDNILSHSPVLVVNIIMMILQKLVGATVFSSSIQLIISGKVFWGSEIKISIHPK